MSSKIEEQTLAILRRVYNATGGRPRQWRPFAGFSVDGVDVQAAVQHAVDHGWMMIENGHSVCLTEVGRRLAEN